MWLLIIFTFEKQIEWLFENEKDVKDYIKRNKPIQYSVRHIRIFRMEK